MPQIITKAYVCILPYHTCSCSNNLYVCTYVTLKNDITYGNYVRMMYMDSIFVTNKMKVTKE